MVLVAKDDGVIGQGKKVLLGKGSMVFFRSREASIRAEDEAIGGVVEGIVETARQRIHRKQRSCQLR